MKKSKKSERAKKPRRGRTSTNPIVRFSFRLAAAVRGLEEVRELAKPPNPLRTIQEIAFIVKQALRESS